MKKVLLKNGTVIDPGSGTFAKRDVLINNGLISSVASDIKSAETDITLDCTDMWICPGLIDMHVHLRDPGLTHKEDINSGSASALHSGFTTIACMPNTNPVNDSTETDTYIKNKVDERKVKGPDIIRIGAITEGLKGKKLVDFDKMQKSGVNNFSDDGMCLTDSGLMNRALAIAKKLQILLIQHPEDHTLSGNGMVNGGSTASALNMPPIDEAAEEIMVERDIILSKKQMYTVHLTHLSTKDSVELVRRAKRDGIPVTSDVTPHHLVLDDSMIIKDQNPMLKMKPPLRSKDDINALIRGLNDNTIDCIATDHAPHTLEEKNRGFKDAPFGITGMETAVPVLMTELVHKKQISPLKFIELLSLNPAKILRLDKKGEIKENYIADITIINPDDEFTIDKDFFVTKSPNSPFIGFKAKGKVEMTIVNGKISYTGGNIESTAPSDI